MKCPYCSLEFDEELAVASCRGCLTIGKCKKIKCPGCGYEMLPEPGWIKSLNRIFNKEERR